MSGLLGFYLVPHLDWKMKYRYQIRALDARWQIVDTQTGVAVQKPYKTLLGATKRAIKLNGGELCLKK